MYIRLLFPITALCCALSQTAFSQFRLSAEIRPRAELRHGFKRPLNTNEAGAFFIEQRTRLHLNYRNQQLELLIVPQDVRIWGDRDQAAKSENTGLTNLHQAWAAYAFHPSHRIRVGRMELDYDNARLLGNLGWAQQSRSHDAVKYEYRDTTWQIHVAAAFNQDSRQPEPAKLSDTYYSGFNNYKAMQFLWVHKQFKSVAASAIILNESRQHAPDTVYQLQTGGTYIQIGRQPIAATVEYYRQRGKTSEGRASNAFLAALQFSAKPIPEITLTAGMDYLSGDDPKTAGNEAFNPLYGTHHQFYGLMDYFYVGNSHQNTGLNDIHAGIAYQKNHHNLQLRAHRFATAAAYAATDTHIAAGNKLGIELDLTYALQISPQFSAQAGFSTLSHTAALRQLKQTETTDGLSTWSWLMLAFTPLLLEN